MYCHHGVHYSTSCCAMNQTFIVTEKLSRFFQMNTTHTNTPLKSVSSVLVWCDSFVVVVVVPAQLSKTRTLTELVNVAEDIVSNPAKNYKVKSADGLWKPF